MSDYDYQKIGKRIRSERQKAGYTSQEKFAENFFLSNSSRQTVGKWENGKSLPNIDNLLIMCDLFHCQLGYLLCEYDCKTGENTNIRKVTGLSEEAINKLKFIKSQPDISDITKALNRIIEHPAFINLLKDIHLHNLTYIDKKFSPSPELRKSLSQELKRPESEMETVMEKMSESKITSDLLKILCDKERTNH